MNLKKILQWSGGAIGVLFLIFGVTLLFFASMSVEPVERDQRQMSSIWYEFPFQSHYIEVFESSMHYVDEGPEDGPVFLLLHGNPTSSYLWREVIPELVESGARVIAVDNIGFGASDRPQIDYTFENHSTYIDEFIRIMDLKNITFVLHDWGAAIGLDYSMRNESNVRAIAFMEGITTVPSMVNLEAPPMIIFRSLRTPGLGEFMVLGNNFFVDTVLPMSVIRELAPAEMAAYREPFQSMRSRVPTLVFPREVPFDGKPSEVASRVMAFAEWAAESDIPKLLLYVRPGALISPEYAETIQEDWTNTQAHFLGDGIHYVQEDHGPEIGRVIAKWWTKEVSENDA